MVKAMKKKPATTAQMDERNRAIVYVHRNPPPGFKKTSYETLKKFVRKTDGTTPTHGAMWEAAKAYVDEKGQRGRKEGWKKTTKEEDKQLMSVFKKNRPAGCYIDSREVHKKLPKRLRTKIGRKTVVRRLAEKGYSMQEKLSKNDASVALCKRRVKFAKQYENWTPAQWKAEVQAVGDFKLFTWYPKSLYSKFKRVRAARTYMNKEERHQSKFQRPRKWFPPKEWKKTRQQKVFAMTTSNGKLFVCLTPKPFNGTLWAGIVRSKLSPFLKRAFPDRRTYTLLLDSEGVMHTPEAKQAYRDSNMKILQAWPKYTPELNPQENVWPEAEKRLRAKEGDGGQRFEQFQQYVLESVREYSGAKNLVGGMTRKISECLASKGQYISS